MVLSKRENDASIKPAALITAGAAGIGRTIAEHLLSLDYAVHVCDIDPDAIELFLKDHPAATATRADVSNADEIASVFRDIEQHHGRLNVLVNNAGIAGPVARVEDIDPQDWERTIAVTLNGAFFASRLAIPLLKAARGGSIVNIASSAAFFGCPLRAPYTSAKWAIVGFTKTLAMELGPFGIRVNAICPGSVNGPRIERVISEDALRRGKTRDEIREAWTHQTSLRRFTNADDVAATVVFLISDAAAIISGQALGVDGHTESLSSPLD